MKLVDYTCTLFQDKGVHLLSIRAMDVPKYALALMDAIFSDDEMGSCCFLPGKRSSKPQLLQEKIELLEGILIQWFSECLTTSTILIC